jgi:hypothetical protein
MSKPTPREGDRRLRVHVIDHAMTRGCGAPGGASRGTGPASGARICERQARWDGAVSLGMRALILVPPQAGFDHLGP